MDESATIGSLEASMRAMTFYLDVSADCCKRIVAHEGALAMICRRLESAELLIDSSRDLAMQCIKVLELVCTREASAVHAAGGLQGSLAFLTNGGDTVFKDALLSAMSVVRSCCRYGTTLWSQSFSLGFLPSRLYACPFAWVSALFTWVAILSLGWPSSCLNATWNGETIHMGRYKLLNLLPSRASMAALKCSPCMHHHVCTICSRMEPTDEKLPACVHQLSLLLMHKDSATKQKALQCFATLAG